MPEFNPQKMEQMRGRAPAWVSLRRIGNSRPVQVSTVFPAVGYFILLSSQVTGLFDGGIAGDHSATTLLHKFWSLKLYFVYFGLVSFGLGSAIYQLRCPRVVRKYADRSEFVMAETPSVTLSDLQIMLELMARSQIVSAEPIVPNELLKDYMRVPIMKYFYAFESAAHPLSRTMTTLFFSAGFVLLAVPSLLTLAKVARLFLAEILPVLH
jgi:hypothetical protein